MNSSAALDILSPDYSLPSYRPLGQPGISVMWPQENNLLQLEVRLIGFGASITEEISGSSAMSTNADSAEIAKIDSAFIGAIGEISRYFFYEQQWDGYFAEPFQPEVLFRASRILKSAKRYLASEERIPSLVTTGPASDGSLDVEIRNGNRTLFYTLYPNVDVEITAIEEGTAPIRRTVPFEEMALAGWLGWLAGKGDLSFDVDSH